MKENTEKTQRRKRTMNPNSLANLKPFEKGKSGNPEGPKPGYKHRGAIYEKILNLQMPVTHLDGTKEEVTVYEAIALGQAKSAMEGNTSAWKEIQDSIHGKIPDKQEVEANVTQKVVVEFVKRDSSTETDTNKG